MGQSNTPISGGIGREGHGETEEERLEEGEGRVGGIKDRNKEKGEGGESLSIHLLPSSFSV